MKELQIGPLLARGSEIHLSLPLLERLMRRNGTDAMKLIFYPNAEGEEVTDETEGRGAFQFFEETPLVWTTTFGDFKKYASEWKFAALPKDPLVFRSPVVSGAWNATATDRGLAVTK